MFSIERIRPITSKLPLLLTSILLFIAAGCAHQIVVSPNQAASTAAGERLPLDVGLYMSDAFRAYQHSENKMGDTWNYTNLGQASANQFRYGLEQRFRSVALLQSKTVNLANSAVVVIIEPEIAGFAFDIPFTKFQVYPATIRYKVSAVGRGGETLYSNIVNGVGDSSGSPGFDFAANPARSGTKAVEMGVNAALDDLVNSAAIKALLNAPPPAPGKPGPKNL
jgi:hypothetical protein